MSLYKSINRLLRSKEVKEMAPFIPYGSFALGTLEKIDAVISDAKEGDPASIETVREVKTRANLGDLKAIKTVAVMKTVSQKQDAKAKSFYARGMSVGHDPVSIGAVRRHSSSSSPAPSGGAARVTDHRSGKPVTYYTARPDGQPNVYSQFGTRPIAPPPMIGPSAPIRTKLPPMPVQPQEDPYGGQGYPPQVDPFGQGGGGYQDPFNYGGYPYDPYAGYGGYGYGGYGTPGNLPYPYPLPGLPYGYGYPEEPVIDKGGFQQYDPTTDSFYSSNQKQVYDEATGMFYPANAENPYASLYGY